MYLASMVGIIFNVGLTSTPCDAHNDVINVGKPQHHFHSITTSLFKRGTRVLTIQIEHKRKISIGRK